MHRAEPQGPAQLLGGPPHHDSAAGPSIAQASVPSGPSFFVNNSDSAISSLLRPQDSSSMPMGSVAGLSLPHSHSYSSGPPSPQLMQEVAGPPSPSHGAPKRPGVGGSFSGGPSASGGGGGGNVSAALGGVMGPERKRKKVGPGRAVPIQMIIIIRYCITQHWEVRDACYSPSRSCRIKVVGIWRRSDGELLSQK